MGRVCVTRRFFFTPFSPTLPLQPPTHTVGKANSWNGKFNPPAGIVCYVDPASGIVTGVDDGSGGRCGVVNGTAVQLPLPAGRFVKTVDVGVVPGTDLIGEIEGERR